MPTEMFQGITAVRTQWDILGDCGGWNDVIQGTLCPVTPAYGHPFAKTLNTVAGNQVSATGISSQLPATMVISAVQVVIKVWNTAVYAGDVRMFCRVGSQISYAPGFSPSAGTPGYVTSAAIARPGGGTWTKTDLQSVEFGIEGLGNGPWNGEPYSGGEVRCRDFQLQVTYVTTSPPIADFSADKLIVFEGDDVQFTDLSSGTPTSWDWDFGDGTTHGTTQNPLHNYATQPAPAPNNKVTVALIATNAGGSDTETKTDYITIWKTTDPVTAAFSGTPVTGDADLTVVFTDASTGYITSWDWDFGDGSAHSTLQNPTHTYTVVGTYTVTLTVSNIHVNDAEVKTDYITVTDPRPEPDFTGTPLSGARPLSVQFTSSITNGKEVTTYAWTFGDGTTSTLANPLHIYTTPGTYSITLTTGNTKGTKSKTRTNYVTVTEIAVAADFYGEPVHGYSPLTVNFRDTSTGDVQTWEWDFGDSTTKSTLQHPTHTYRAAGSYTVTLIVNKATSNTDTETKTAYITVVNTSSYGRFLDDLRRDLMEDPEDDVCGAFTEFGGLAYVLDVLYDRLCRFNIETGVLRKEGTPSVSTSGSIYQLPQDLIKLLRVEADGQRIEALDQFEADMSSGNWEGTAGELLGYIYEPHADSLRFQLVPKQAADPTLKVIYLYAPSRPTVPVTCITTPDPWPVFPIPYIFWWILRFGVMSDLLKMEGAFYDLDRATACEQLYQYGIAVTKALLQQGMKE